MRYFIEPSRPTHKRPVPLMMVNPDDAEGPPAPLVGWLRCQPRDGRGHLRSGTTTTATALKAGKK